MAKAMVEVDLPYLPKFRGARYPKGLQTDFRRLQYRALATYVKRHSLRVRPDATQSELAVVVASHFHAMKQQVNEEGVICRIVDKYLLSGNTFEPQTFQLNEINGQTPKISWGVKRNGKNRNERAASKLHSQESSNHRETVKEGKVTRTLTRSASCSNSPPRESFDIAQQGEQVAMLNEDSEEQGWILARVIRYNLETQEYECRDEDYDGDTSKPMRVDRHKVIRLGGTLRNIEVGDEVLAVFPDTTSFYQAIVQKIARSGPRPSDHDVAYIVKFLDDEDESGSTPSRSIMSQYIIQLLNGDSDEISMESTSSTCTRSIKG
eukprot:53916_1